MKFIEQEAKEKVEEIDAKVGIFTAIKSLFINKQFDFKF